MGILDDAIREHLELKRKLGAREAEVKQLEDEAFGPPARPGEPEFGEQPSSELSSELAELDRQTAPAEPSIEAHRTAERRSTEPEPPSESVDEWLSGFPPDPPRPSKQAREPAGEAGEASREPPADDPSDAGHARGRFPELDETAAHEPAREPESDPGTAAEGGPAGKTPESLEEEEEEEAIYDRGGEPDSSEIEAPSAELGELDRGEIDLGFDDELEQAPEDPPAERRITEPPAEPGSPREAMREDERLEHEGDEGEPESQRGGDAARRLRGSGRPGPRRPGACERDGIARRRCDPGPRTARRSRALAGSRGAGERSEHREEGVVSYVPAQLCDTAAAGWV